MANANHTPAVQSDELTPEQLAEIEQLAAEVCAGIFTPEFYVELEAGAADIKRHAAERRARLGA